jgi:hypothetical protein
LRTKQNTLKWGKDGKRERKIQRKKEKSERQKMRKKEK